MYGNIFCTAKSELEEYLKKYTPYHFLTELKNIIYELAVKYNKVRINKEFYHNKNLFEGDIFIGKDVVIQYNVFIKGPVIIGDHAFIGANSFIRDCVYIGRNTVIGYGNEICNSVVMDNTIVSHHSMISCSVIGQNVNIGSHVVAMSYFLFKYKFAHNKRPIFAGFHEKNRQNFLKIGALIGDNTQLGAFVGLNPGTVIEKNCIIYPGVIVPWGRYKRNSILKTKTNLDIIEYGI